MKIPIDKIEVIDGEDNQEVIEQIAQSFKEQGQLHPILVKVKGEGYYILVTGRQRIRAALSLNWTELECTILEATVSSREIQLHENLKRANLPWYEEVRLKKELHELRQSQHGSSDSQRGRPRLGESKVGWGVRDTARELGEAFGGVSQDINLALAVERDPTLKGIRDKHTARRIARTRAIQSNSEAENAFSGDFSGVNEVFCGDSSQILSEFSTLIFDACITDPPWLEFSNKELIRDEKTKSVFEALYPKMKYDSFLYMFVGIDDFIFYKGVLAKIGWRVFKTPAIWWKPNIMTMSNDISFRYNRDYELILIAAKGKPAPTFNKSKSSIFNMPAITGRALTHPNEKPVPLIVQLIEDCTYRGGVVIDPFAGSGSTGIACLKTNRKYVLIERNQEYFEKIRKRLEK